MAEISDLLTEMKQQGASRREEMKVLEASREELNNLKKEIEAQGGDAEKNAEYSKQQLDLDRKEFQLSLKTMSPSAKKEALKDQAKKDARQLTVLQRINQGIMGFGSSLKDKAAGAVGGIFGFLKKAAVIALLFLLPKILNSQFAKDTVKFLEEKIPIVFEGLKNLFIRIKNGFGPLIDFVKNPSFTSFKELFNADTGIAAGFALLTASLLVFGPAKILKSSLGLAIKAFTLGLKGIGAGLSLLGLGGGAAAGGAAAAGLTGDKDKTKPKKKNPFLKAAKVAKVGVKAIPVVGLIATAAFGIFDGVRAGLEEAKKETANAGTIARESISGVLSGLTFGIVKQETISKGFQTIGDKTVEGFNFLKDGFTTGIETIKNIEIPTMEEVGASITETGLKIKDGFGKVRDKLTESKDMLVNSFEEVTGIELPKFDDVTEKLKKFGDNLKERVLSFIPSKESILSFGGKIKDFVADKISGSEDEQEKIKQAVDEALKLHFETDHVAEKIQENAMNKDKVSAEGSSPMLVSNNQSSSNTNNYASYNSRVTSTDTSTQNIVNQN